MRALAAGQGVSGISGNPAPPAAPSILPNLDSAFGQAPRAAPSMSADPRAYHPYGPIGGNPVTFHFNGHEHVDIHVYSGHSYYMNQPPATQCPLASYGSPFSPPHFISTENPFADTGFLTDIENNLRAQNQPTANVVQAPAPPFQTVTSMGPPIPTAAASLSDTNVTTSTSTANNGNGTRSRGRSQKLSSDDSTKGYNMLIADSAHSHFGPA